jgi:DNA-binding transcriptional LysR family regulator
MSLDAFRSVPHAVADGAGYVHEALDRWLMRQKVQRHVKVNVPHFLVLPLIVARSDLLAITAGRLAEMFATMVPLNIMPLPMKMPGYDINVFWHERFHRDPANRWFRNFLAATLKE